VSDNDVDRIKSLIAKLRRPAEAKRRGRRSPATRWNSSPERITALLAPLPASPVSPALPPTMT